MVEIIRGTTQKAVCGDCLERVFRENKEIELSGQLYIGYPIFATPEGKYPIDALFVSPKKGVVLINFVEGTEIPPDYQDLQDDVCNKLEAKLRNYKNLLLRRELKISINSFTFIPALSSQRCSKDNHICNSDNLLSFIDSIPDSETNEEYNKPLLSAIQSISTLRSNVHKREVKKDTSRGSKLLQLENAIATLDTQQGKAVIETVNGVQRIRGLAGSGKTIVLALKAAYLHAQHPDWKIAVTFQTRALKGQFKRLIRGFTIEQTGMEPDWDNIRIIHAWGSGVDKDEGVYYDFCLIHHISPMNLHDAKNRFSGGLGHIFDGACKTALESAKEDIISFNAILIDEAQDLPESFLQLCYSLLDENKRLVYAYDELQSLNKHSMPSPEAIFGKDKDGKPLVTLSNPSQDIILEKCYRNSKPVLTTAHALGFGIYRQIDPKTNTGLIQMFDNKQLWKDIGYSVVSGDLLEDHNVVLERTAESSPVFLENHSPTDDLLVFKVFSEKKEQADWIVEEIQKNLNEDELRYDDIIVINPNPLTTKDEVGIIRSLLFEKGIASHLAGVDTNPDIFFKPGCESIAFSGIYRAKGNEAGMVYIINAQDCYSSFGELPTVRNRLFTAITRSKAWVRVLGVGENMEKLNQEFLAVKDKNFKLAFKYPSIELRQKLNIVNRDMSQIEMNKIRNADKSLGDILNDLLNGSINIEDIDQRKIQMLQKILQEKGDK